MDKDKAKSISNSLKSNAGKKWDESIQLKLEHLKNEGVISDSTRNLNFQHTGYNYEKQYLANFVIYTNDNKRIIIRSSNSFRDRVKIGFYDIEGILKYSNLKDDIVATIYLVPDSELSNTTFITTRRKIINKEYYSPATHLLTLSEFEHFLTNYELENRAILEELVEDKKATNLKEAGSYYGKMGNKLEREISETVKIPKFISELEQNKKPQFYEILEFITKKHNIKYDDILKINSSNSIPLLLSGGSPKTDIWIELECIDTKIFETFSIKNSSKRSVSVHDYSADRFINVMKCNTHLEYYFNHFQAHPTYSDFEKNLDKGKSEEEFENLVKPKRSILSEWALLGKYDVKNLNYPKLQISNNLILNTKGELLIYDSLEYLEYLYLNEKTKYGIPYSWTYPSKQRKKRIQLKLPIRKIIEL
jgi:hypothetical protein